MSRLFLSRCGLLGALLCSSVALAADVEVHTGGPVVADGQPVEVQLYSPTLTPESRVKLLVAGEKRADVDLSEPGFLRFTLTPPADDAASAIPLTLTVRGAGGKLDATAEVPVVPAGRAPLEISFEPALFTVGTDEAAKVWITPPAGLQELDARSFSVHSSSGVIDALTPVGDGRYVARWTPPRRMTEPQVVLFAVSEDNRPGEVYGVAPLPVLVEQDVRFEVEPGATVLLQTGQRKYGPNKADAAGKVAFTVSVDPREPRGTLTVAVDGSSSDRAVDLPVAAGERLTFSPVPRGLPADPSVQVPVVLYGFSAGGRALPDEPTLTVDRGSVSALQAGPVRGTWIADYTPAAEPGAVTFQATAGGAETSRGTTLVAAPAAPRAQIDADPAVLEDDTEELTLTVTLKTPEGQAVVGQRPGLVLQGADTQGRVADNGDGTYTFQLRPTASRVLATVRPRAVPTGLPPAELTAWTLDPALAPGETTVALVGVRDASGVPVPGVPVRLSSQGLTAPSEGTTDDGGLVSVPVTLGDAGVGRLSVRAAGLTTELLLFPEPPDRASLPPVGSAEAVAAQAAWGERATALLIASSEPAPVVAAASGDESAADEPSGASRAQTSDRPTPSGLRIFGVFQPGVAAHKYSSTAQALNADPSIPPSVSYATGLAALNLDQRAEVRVGPSFGLDIRTRMIIENLATAETEDLAVNLDGIVTGLYFFEPIPNLEVHGAAGYHLLMVPVLTGDRAEPEVLSSTEAWVQGVRVGAGATYYMGDFRAGIELAETFASAPSVHHLALTGTYQMNPFAAVLVGMQAEGRRLRTEVLGTDVDVRDSVFVLHAGFRYVPQRFLRYSGAGGMGYGE